MIRPYGNLTRSRRPMATYRRWTLGEIFLCMCAAAAVAEVVRWMLS